MKEEPRIQGHYNYFSSLEKTIKLALAAYLSILICGIASLSWGIGSVREFLVDLEWVGVYPAVALTAVFGCVYILVNRIRWLGDLHNWLDRRFFGFLEKSNDIIFQALLRVLEREDRSHVNGLGSEARYSLTQSIFARLADDFHLFDSVMRSGIFRLWIWYWVVNYGTFTFTLLTVGCFTVMLGSSTAPLRPLFTVCWIAALTHLAVNIGLGHVLTRMTKRVSESIVASYRPRISVLLREAIVR